MLSLIRPLRLALRTCALALLVTVGVRAAADEPTNINLMFTGSGTVTANDTHFENRYNFKTKKYDNALVTNTGRKPFTGSGYVEISGGNARMKLPSKMVPPLNGGNDGWFLLSELWINEREITGIVRLNALNKPKVRIDRNTGVITISGGFSEFSGQCEVVNPNAPKRKF